MEAFTTVGSCCNWEYIYNTKKWGNKEEVMMRKQDEGNNNDKKENKRKENGDGERSKERTFC